MQQHSFHIPVMGIGYTIDTPVRVAHLGIASVISLVDDSLMERMREFYCKLHERPFEAIPIKIEDSRAQRITAYLNLVHELVSEKFNEFKATIEQKRDELARFISLLPDSSMLKQKIAQVAELASNMEIREIISSYLHPGSIDVNIMTKLDKENYKFGEKLPVEYNDAHAALRGFANSSLNSSLVLSAGMSPRLYTYMEQFSDFYPDENGRLRKKIILKVSDYRSALVQGRIFAKKGLWLSELRVESGLNCGGHTFATQGYLMGPILEEFSVNRDELTKELFELYTAGLKAKNLPVPTEPPAMRLTAQGGVGTAEEHQFLIQRYNLDGVGWGSPFLLVPEVVSIDKDTLNLLATSGEDDFFLSHVSPVGVRFNNVKGATAEIDQANRVAIGKPGAPCNKKFILFNTEFTDRPICTSSSQYQELKLKELAGSGLDSEVLARKSKQVVGKSCICTGLGIAALRSHGMGNEVEGQGVSVCPGPNLAYFNREATLKEMIDHIYGRANLISHPSRPNLFIKELGMYLDFLEEELDEIDEPDARQFKSWQQFTDNLLSGINYYESLFSSEDGFSVNTRKDSLDRLATCRQRYEGLIKKVGNKHKIACATAT